MSTLCGKCNKLYTYIYHKWCGPCHIDNFKKNFTNWTSGNKTIDDFIQKVQLEIDSVLESVLEWIPYNQLEDVKIISKDNSVATYSAIWVDGPLYYDKEKEAYIRNQNEKVSLKCLHNSLDMISKLLCEVFKNIIYLFMYFFFKKFFFM